MKQFEKDDEFADKLIILENVINYIPVINNGWSLPIEKLKVFGELTTNEGPIAGDYYLVFVTNENEWKVASAYVANQREFIEELGKRLNSGITLNLFSSTNWTSNVLWPEQIGGRQLMEFKKLPPKNFVERIKEKLGLGSPVTLILTDEVKQFITT